MTELGVMHKAGYVDSIWSTHYHFHYGYFTFVHFNIWEVPLAGARAFIYS